MNSLPASLMPRRVMTALPPEGLGDPTPDTATLRQSCRMPLGVVPRTTSTMTRMSRKLALMEARWAVLQQANEPDRDRRLINRRPDHSLSQEKQNVSWNQTH